jgi:2Fe-2S iron-sulfur cluster binding domain/NADH-ubiquinone oxidoreductase-G iron-sulfur binding region
MADVTITVDGKKVIQPVGTLLIEACKIVELRFRPSAITPLSLQGACRMCLVEIAKMPKLQTACTTVISEGMVVTTDSDTVKQARRTMLEFVLQNHPLDCPVCDAGGAEEEDGERRDVAEGDGDEVPRVGARRHRAKAGRFDRSAAADYDHCRPQSYPEVAKLAMYFHPVRGDQARLHNEEHQPGREQ